jgi:hydrogenase maturation factor HypE
MSRTPAKVTQADVARTIRAAIQAGARGVEVRPDGTMFIHLTPVHTAGKTAQHPEKELEQDGGAVL